MASFCTRSFAGLAAATTIAAVGCATSPSHRDALWRIVHDDCVPAAQGGGTGKCVEVDVARGVEAGDAVLKDLNGPLQFLLIPTARVTGIEDARLLRLDAPPYFADAWRARRWMDVSHGAPIPADDVAIAVNSLLARSQDQLHLHVSCIRADLKAFLSSHETAIGDGWAVLPGGWQGHPYEARRIVAASLDGEDPFRDVATHVPDAANDMGHQAIAVVGATFADGRQGFWLLETHVAPMSAWLAGIEGDVQDHDCAVLR